MSKFSRFEPASAVPTCLKAGFFGGAASGKTFTACTLARGIILASKAKNVPSSGKPVYFIDTETGSAYVREIFNDAGIELCVANTRAFADLVPMISDAEHNGSVLIIDSITHFWTELCDSYLQKLQKKYKNKVKLEFQDWAVIKPMWQTFTDSFLNANIHIILCGREGSNYDHVIDDRGKRQLVKTETKLKAESGFGYEPSLLVHLQRVHDADNDCNHRTATVVKCRFNAIDGQVFELPMERNIDTITRTVYKAFAPHIERLNIGGSNNPVVDTVSSTVDYLPDDLDGGDTTLEQQRLIVLDEIKELLIKHYPSGFGADKETKASLLEETFGTRSWEKIRTFALGQLQEGWINIHSRLTIPHRPNDCSRLDKPHTMDIDDVQDIPNNSEKPNPNPESESESRIRIEKPNPNPKTESVDEIKAWKFEPDPESESKSKIEKEKPNLENRIVETESESDGFYYWPKECPEYKADPKRMARAESFIRKLIVDLKIEETSIIGMYKSDDRIKKLEACLCTKEGKMVRQ